MLTDLEREERIEDLGRRLVTSSDLTERARLWREMRDLITHRSQKQVRVMEREKGLK